MDDVQLGIADVARLVNLDADTLWFYEQRGFLPPPTRDAGGRRLYASDQVETIQRLVALKATGMSLADIARGAAVIERGLDPAQLEALRRHEAELREHRRRIDAGLEFSGHKLNTAGREVPGRIRHLTRSDAEIAYSVMGSGP